MHLEYLRTLLAVAELGSFSAAARALHISQPAVSLQIKEVERLFGARLLARDGGPVRPTGDGERVLPLIEECLQSFDGARLAVGQRAPAASVVRVSAGISTVEYALPLLLNAFTRDHPDTQLVVVSACRRGEVCTQVAGHQADVGLITAETGPPLRQLGTFELRGAAEAVVLVAPPQHPWSRFPQPLELEQFLSEPVILQEGDSAIRKAVTNRLAELGVLDRLQVRMELSSNEAVRSTVRAGMGVGFLPISAISSDVQAGDVIRIEVQGLAVARQWSVIYRKGDEARPAVARLLHYLRNFRPEPVPAGGRN